jgi:ubiquinone/menaquinone biosynthesis C-methylase UbiE
MKNIDEHFSTIAQKYKELRTTDSEPIIYIKETVQNLPKIVAADIGCGAGRYVKKLFQHLGDKLYLYCIDCNKEMLEELRKYLTEHKAKNFQLRNTLARQLPLPNESLDCVFTFNAIHHFQIIEFLNEASRVLKEGGYLFVYTRLRCQNRSSIWGKYFPLFTQKETRLHELDELKNVIEKIEGLTIQDIIFFKYHRCSSLDWLVEQARYHHYSTFHFYTKEEFEKSLDEFKRRLKRHFRDLNQISWFDRNILLVGSAGAFEQKGTVSISVRS